MLDEVRTGTDDAHVAMEHIPKLRDFVDAEFAEPFSKRVNAFVAIAGLPLHLFVIGTHSAEFVNFELSILHAGADLRVKKRARRLEPLRDPNDGREERENEKHHRNCDGEIDSSFEKTVQWALQRFFTQANKAEAIVFEVRHGMPQLFLQIADYDEPDAELIANANDIAVDLGEERELQQNDLGNAELPNYLLEFVRRAENGIPSSVLSIFSSQIKPTVRCPISALRRIQSRSWAALRVEPTSKVFHPVCRRRFRVPETKADSGVRKVTPRRAMEQN